LVRPTHGVAFQGLDRHGRQSLQRHLVEIHAQVLTVHMVVQVEELGWVRRTVWRHQRADKGIDIALFVTDRAEWRAFAQLQPEKTASTGHRGTGHLVRPHQLLKAEVAAFWNGLEGSHEFLFLLLWLKYTHSRGGQSQITGIEETPRSCAPLITSRGLPGAMRKSPS